MSLPVLFYLTKSVYSSTETIPPLPPLPSCFYQTPNVMSSAENLLEKYTQGLNVTDEILINQLLEIPELMNALSSPNLPCTLGLDASTTFDDLDMSFNPNFGTYPQDFSHLNEIQFNMLVNENQNPQAEPQDSVLQVKTEEEQ